MGRSHALAYHRLPGFEICGLVSRQPTSRERLANELGLDIPLFSDFSKALEQCRPEAVSINTYTESHAPYALEALEYGAHIFVEKPLASTVEEAQLVVETARRKRRVLLVGYILRHHPAWQRFIQEARALGKPLVMRMSLNQQSSGSAWDIHKNLLRSTSPIVDCGVHYVDVMCQMTESEPISAHSIDARLSDEIDPQMTNYGQLQLRFADGSVGWYESGWGPMISEEAACVKDVFGPLGSVTLLSPGGKSADLESHTAHHTLRICKGGKEEIVELEAEMSHDALCEREQHFFLRAIEDDLDLTEHHQSAVLSLRTCKNRQK